MCVAPFLFRAFARCAAAAAAAAAAAGRRQPPPAAPAPQPLTPPPPSSPPQLEEFWQSDGAQPHIISIQFRRRTALSELAFYVDHAADESYTPRTVSLRAGSLHHDLEELRRFELPGPVAGHPGAAPVGPVGWVRVPLGDPAGKGVSRYLRTWYLQLMVMGMHANGRDLHIRCVKVMGPGATAGGGAAPLAEGAEEELEWGGGGGPEALAARGFDVR